MAKKRRTRQFKKRSEAAKRGWETRRKKQVLKKEIVVKTTLIRNAKKGVKKKELKELEKSKTKIPKKKKRTVEELEAIIAQKDEELRIHKLTKDWVHGMPDEYLHRDGTLALCMSRARHLGTITDDAYALLEKAYHESSIQFDRMANILAEKLDLPVREIYTLWFSP